MSVTHIPHSFNQLQKCHCISELISIQPTPLMNTYLLSNYITKQCCFEHPSPHISIKSIFRNGTFSSKQILLFPFCYFSFWLHWVFVVAHTLSLESKANLKRWQILPNYPSVTVSVKLNNLVPVSLYLHYSWIYIIC